MNIRSQFIPIPLILQLSPLWDQPTFGPHSALHPTMAGDKTDHFYPEKQPLHKAQCSLKMLKMFVKISLWRRHAMPIFLEILNPEGHLNCITGSKVTAILLNWWILPIGGASAMKGLGLQPAQRACLIGWCTSSLVSPSCVRVLCRLCLISVCS